MKRIGHKNITYDSFETIKKELLMFDQLMVDSVSIDQYLSFSFLRDDEFKNKRKQIEADIQYLIDSNLAFDFRTSKFLMPVGIERIKINKQFKEEFQNNNPSKGKFHNLQHESYANFSYYMRAVMGKGDLSHENLDNYFDVRTRIDNIILQDKFHDSEFDFIPVIKSYHKLENLDSNLTEIINLTFKDIPIPDESCSLEKIAEFKKHPDTRKKYLRIVNWINKISQKELNPHHLNDEIKLLISEYEEHMKAQKLKYNSGTLEIILSTTLELLENTLKLNLGKIPKVFFGLKKRKADLIIGEGKAPGKELAYLSKIKENF